MRFMSKKYSLGKWSMLSQRQRMSPFPNYMSMESVCRGMQKFVGTKLKETLLIFEGNLMYAYLGSKDYVRAGRFIADRVHGNPKLYAGLVKKQKVYGKKLVDFTKKCSKKVSAKINPAELYKMFAGYDQHYQNVYASYGSVWTMEDHLQGDLLKIMAKRVKDPAKAVEILNVLTKEPSAMVSTMERKALLELAVKIDSKEIWRKKLTQGEEFIKTEKTLAGLIKKHVDNYFWITRDYEDPIMTFEKVIARLSEFLKTNSKKQYNQLITELKATADKQKKYSKDLKLTVKESALFLAMRSAAYLKELRKHYVSESLYYFDPVLNEIGRRLFLSIKQVRFMRTLDVANALLKNKDLTNEVNLRIKLSAWLTSANKPTKVLTGKDAQELYDRFCKVDKNATEFRGMPVSPGVACGPVKIVLNPNECGKVQKGDIIVSVQVVPSFSTAIIKAAGIVCDGGHGITSHPATLAREAGIPCVIQTRFAKDVLKDGDMVEVDGYKGIVRKI